MENTLNKSKEIDFDKVLDFYNNSTPVEKCQFLIMISERIMVPIQKDKYVDCMNLDKEVPVVMNGPYFQINTEDLYKNQK